MTLHHHPRQVVRSVVVAACSLLLWTATSAPIGGDQVKQSTGAPVLQAPPATPPSRSPAAAEEQAKNLVVMIRGKVGDVDVIGAGIIFTIDQDRLYVATANHVVRQGPQTTITGLQVLLKWLPGEWKPAELLADFDTDMDLAVINVRGARSLLLSQRLLFDRLAPEVKRLDQVFTIGYPAGQPWYPRVTPDIVSETTSERVSFETSYLQRGHSGGALVNANWEIVGLLKQDVPPQGIAIRMDRVVEWLGQRGYRNSLTRSVPATNADSGGGSPDVGRRGTVPGGRGTRGTAANPRTPLMLLNRAGWPMYGRDETHTNWNRDEASLRPPLTLLRSIPVRDLTITSVVAAEGRLFATGRGQDRNELVGIDAGSGRLEWGFPTGAGRGGGTPAYASGLVLAPGTTSAAGAPGALHAIESATGKLLWKAEGNYRTPVVSGERVYAFTPDALVAIDARTGRTAWQYQVQARQAAPLAAGNLLLMVGASGPQATPLLHVVGSDGAFIRSFEISTSHPVMWQRPPNLGRVAWAVGVGSGRESALYSVGGVPLWRTQLPTDERPLFPQLAYANGFVLVKTTSANVLYALDSETGRISWQLNLGTESSLAPVVANNVVYVVWRTVPKVIALDLKTGRELWSAAPPGTATGNPIVAYGYLFIPAGNAVHVFGAGVPQ